MTTVYGKIVMQDDDRTIEYVTSNTSLSDVMRERERQDIKWGEQNHDPFTYLTVLGEEFGELCQAALHLRFGGKAAANLREEAIHTAAVALALVECLDRAKWQWPSETQPGGTQ